jgi:hypothetical protein
MPRWPEGDRATISNFIANRVECRRARLSDQLACGCDGRRGQPGYRQLLGAIGTVGPAPNSSLVNPFGTGVFRDWDLRGTGFS